MKRKVLDSQIAALKAHAQNKNKETLDKVHTTIDRMKKQKVDINFETVSKEAGVTRATLYNNVQLKERILSLRGVIRSKPLNSGAYKKKDTHQIKDEKIAELRDRINKLEEDNKKLFLQLVDYAELKEENEHLKKNFK